MAARLLVVTDADSVLQEVRFGFSGEFDVDVAVDARRALESMLRRRPAVAIVDIQTGSSGGFALARDMTFDKRLRTVPVIMLLEREQDRWLAQQAGAKAVRVKPVNAAQLIADVEGLVAK